MNIPLILVAISFTGLGILMRKQNKKNWKAILIVGILCCVLAVVSTALSFVNQ